MSDKNQRLKSFSDLSTLKSKAPRIKPKKVPKPIPSPERLLGDGVDHINIWDSATTKIGQFLSHDKNNIVRHPLLGTFSNMYSLWYYVSSKERDDSIRTMRGKPLKLFASYLTSIIVPNFKAIIADTQWKRVKANKAIYEEIRKSTLPYECYYIPNANGIKVRPSFFKWLLAIHEEIRKAIKENREPNFDIFLDVKGSGIYDFINDHIEREKQRKLHSFNKTENNKKQKKEKVVNNPPTVVESVLSEEVTIKEVINN